MGRRSRQGPCSAHSMMWQMCLVLMLSTWAVGRAHAMLSQKPAMGWNSWNAFATHIDERLIRFTANAMRDLGLVDAGYTYLNLDDGWSAPIRNATRELQAHPLRFPLGIPALVEYAADSGLKLGLYTDAGALTCGGFPASAAHEEIDARTFANWGIGYLKVDNCWADQSTVVERYRTMGTALRNAAKESGQGTGEIVFSLCSWGVGQPWRGWGREVGGQSWRTSQDVWYQWWSILQNLDSVMGLSKYAGPGGWNDPDMLEVGNGDLSLANQKSHFALWALVKSPLLIGASLAWLASEDGKGSLEVLKAKEVIAINQDDLGVAGDVVYAEGILQVWACPLSDGSRAVVLLNRNWYIWDEQPPNITVTWDMLGWSKGTLVTVRDLYEEKDIATMVKGSYTAKVPGGDSLTIKLTPASSTAGAGKDDGWRPWHAPHPSALKEIQRAEARRADTKVWRAAQERYRETRQKRAQQGRAREQHTDVHTSSATFDTA